MNIITLQKAREQGLMRYFTGKSCKHGHIAERQTSSATCIECARLKSVAAYQADPEKARVLRRQWKEANRDALNLRQRENYRQCPEARERAKAKSVAWRKANPEAKREADRRYRRANWGQLCANKRAYEKSRRASDPEYAQSRRELLNRSRKRRMVQDPSFRVSCSLRTRLHQALNERGAVKSAKISELVGCSSVDLVAYLETQFLPGMSWENYGYKTWHIDHVRPCASFNLIDPDQQKLCFHYTNLQPLWAKDNMRKSNRLDWGPLALQG
jgi:hypothetical protein